MIKLNQHIKDRLSLYVGEGNEHFSMIYQGIENANKEVAKNLLLYVNNLLDDSITQQESLKYTHLHFEGCADEIIQLMAEFIAIKFFYLALNTDQSDSAEMLEKRIRQASQTLEKPIAYPEGVKGGSRSDRQIKEQRKSLRQRLKFYQGIQAINVNASFRSKTLINLSQNQCDDLRDLSYARPFSCYIDDIKTEYGYVVTNDHLTRDEIDGMSLGDGLPLLDQIENVVLFDCEQKQIHRKLHFSELLSFNKSTARFRNLIILSFAGGTFRFIKLRNRLDRILNRYYGHTNPRENVSYTITPFEVQALLKRNEPPKITLEFFDSDRSSYWDDFKILIGRFEGLYELRSLKMTTIYSLVVNARLKAFLLNDLFGGNDQSRFLSEETNAEIKELNESTRNELQSSLSNILDQIINSGWVNHIRMRIEKSTILVLPNAIVCNSLFINQLRESLGIENVNRIVTWFTIDFNTTNAVLILEYRDPGQFPYGISPNVIENCFLNSPKATGIFLAYFFQSRYKWTSFSLSKSFYSLLRHPIRQSKFEWNSLYATIGALRPTVDETIDWGKEETYQGFSQSTTVRIKFKEGNRSKVFHPSDRFIILRNDSKRLRALPLEDLMDEDPKENAMKIQALDELHSEFNVYEKIANIEREQKELDVIRAKYDLIHIESPGGLWKELLRIKCDVVGLTEFYQLTKSSLESKGLGIVSFSTFKDSWTDPNSVSLIPREKRVFLALCEDLELPKTYYRIMLRLKNVEKLRARKSGQQMNNLLMDLVNDGCFDEINETSAILLERKAKYLAKHDLDEIGISEEQFAEELKALIVLLKPYLKLNQVEAIEMT